jgi:molecular chaperone DnaK (HSP70)
MSFTLTDLPAAIDGYLQTEVTTTISPVTPTDTTQDVLTPGQKGHVTVTVTKQRRHQGPPPG